MKTKRFLSFAAIMAIFAFLQVSCEEKEDPAAREARREARKEAQKEEIKKELQAEAAAKQAAEEAAAAEKKRQEKIAQENARAMEQKRKREDLERNPNKYIKSSQCDIQTSGVVNLYIDLNKCTFANNSNFGIDHIFGNLVVTTSNGTKIVVPFKTQIGLYLNPRSTVVSPIFGIKKVKIPSKLTSITLEILGVYLTGI